ncbi:TQXA domain-containing protein [Mycobacterium lacus]|uniref:TQXA domain-containing protein n=1 Tax=Mycobacterium lacus TaxID=169765 RepID=A0A1X1Y125_9MYCO|nr:TQXA domain-containing protein [Mycobacterium lacus]MCV7123326.1 TQXA domain-containing protein [Mycobacterium lacus]ORW04736.1 TQXA domain-containing protein [Mycobacterium lacus]BBX97108.1 TQXA domain-containing protein [Mycobacterium lacus]
MTVLSLPGRAVAPVATRRRIQLRPVTDLTRMTRYRGGTYSHTVDKIVFADGTSARTDLIRLNPNLQAYSLDFTGTAPHHPSRYRLDTWSALPHLRTRGCEAEVNWILRHSFPIRPAAELSEQLREAGYPLGPANISEHEAIAGTQAAIWHLTNGLALDTRPLNVPVAMHRAPGPVITFEFDGDPQLGGYSVWVASDTTVGITLQKSANGVDWQDISGSQLTASAGRSRHRRTLGVGSTLSASSHGRGGRGYRYYRLITTADGPTPTIDRVRFWLTGSRHYRNADRVVHLYNYLLAGARKAAHHNEEPLLIDTKATAESDLVGPFQLRIPLTLNASDGHTLLDVDGIAIDDTIQPGTDFYLRRAPGATGTTLTAMAPHHSSRRVLIGVAREEAPQALPGPTAFTPVALTTPANVAIHFDISWDGDCRADNVGEADEHR